MGSSSFPGADSGTSDREGRYRSVLSRIEAAARSSGRDPGEIRLIAVSKKQPAAEILELYRLGQRDFGENYVQELLTKARELDQLGCPGIRWHFIGHLQTNKARALLSRVSCVHSVDSERAGLALSREAAPPSGIWPLPVFIEVNLGGETSKSGVDPGSVGDLARTVALLPGLSLQGLMCVPEPGLTGEGLRSRFRQLRELQRGCHGALSRLSMGMSADFEIAIAEGATDIRVGTALFGPRS